MRFRPDIEGLRAVAILLVVLAHAKVSGFSGGFIGVDVFFVLSGYLITGLLTQELVANGRIRLINFYARRFRRLFPSLLLVLVVTSVLGQQLLPVGEQPTQAIAAASAVAWLSNLYFAFSAFDYFSAGAEANLFLHTWSLGVEEQFYLVWPALVLALVKSHVGAAGGINIDRLKITMAALAVLGFLGCVVWTSFNPIQAFYLMPARAWQFATGAVVFLYLHNSTKESGSRVLYWCGWTGLVAILMAALLFDPESEYPGIRALLPTLGSAMVLASGTYKPGVGVGRLLSLPVMQSLGRVSYVWYLWHWPVLLLGATIFNFESAGVRAGLVVLSLALAALSHVLVESPLRDAKRLPLAPAKVLIVSVVLMVAGNGLAIRWNNDALQRVENVHQYPSERARWDAPSIYAMGCDEWYHSDAVKVCGFGPADASKTVVAMGDSIGLQWFPAIEGAFLARGWRLLVITKSSCPMVDEPIFYQRIGRRYEICERWRRDALDFVANLKPEVVILGSTYTYNFDESQWREGTKRIVRDLAQSAERIYILRSTPTLPFNAPSCLAPRGWLFERLVKSGRCAVSVGNDHWNRVHRWIESALVPFDNARVVDMTDMVCPEGKCRAKIGDQIVYRDAQHLTASFARSLAEELYRRLESGR